VATSSRPELRLDWCDARAARFACKNWHYSRTLPTNKSNWIGVWEGEQFRGVVVFGLGASPSLGKPYRLGIFECCELTRVALREHDWPVSRLVRIALKMLKVRNPGLRLCISFADTFHDHHGGIYQAGGWVYAGQTDPAEMWRLPDGSLFDPRRFNGHGYNAPRAVPRDARKVRTPGKHRYLMPLDDEMRAKIAPLAKPYPKRAGGAASGTSPDQGGRGGATPTPALFECVNEGN
jgi:hypothetical protein